MRETLEINSRFDPRQIFLALLLWNNLCRPTKVIAIKCTRGLRSTISNFFCNGIQAVDAHTQKATNPASPKNPKQAQLIRINKTSLTWSWILVFFSVVLPFQYFMSEHLSAEQRAAFVLESLIWFIAEGLLRADWTILNWTHFSEEALDSTASALTWYCSYS